METLRAEFKHRDARNLFVVVSHVDEIKSEKRRAAMLNDIKCAVVAAVPGYCCLFRFVLVRFGSFRCVSASFFVCSWFISRISVCFGKFFVCSCL